MSKPSRIHSKVFIKGILVANTGLHIGGNSVGMAIGGADSVVVRNPLTNDPYIPGSSLRGKMRSLLERVRGAEAYNQNPEGGFSYEEKEGENGKKKIVALAGNNGETVLGKLFGVSAAEASKDNFKEPTRLIVRDAKLTEASRKRLENAPNTDMPMTEVKTEVWIDRITSAANPRQVERVPAGAEFEFELVLTVLESDDKKRFIKLIYEGLRLVEGDALGGCGSRGYGQVKFQIDQVTERTAKAYRDGTEATPLEEPEIPSELIRQTA